VIILTEKQFLEIVLKISRDFLSARKFREKTNQFSIPEWARENKAQLN